ncbi:MAG: hypothetical protein J7502_16915 [Flavisolibacter sp.]|nr:hypothetical protein [Flavisolibacter sp.]
MKKILFLSLVSLVAFASCKKDDIKTKAAQSSETIGTTSSWKAIENWSSSEGSYKASLSDDRISSDITNEGLVLVYAKSYNSSTLLPAQIGNTYLYYQVENGSVQIVANSAAPGETLQFIYIIFSKDQLNTLNQKGINASQLLKMNYQQITQLKN